MKILILGGSGMLGHQLWRHLSLHHDVYVTLRRPAGRFLSRGLFTGDRVVPDFDAADSAIVHRVIREIRPDAVLNCIGIIKQLKEALSPIPSLQINALLPHLAAEACAAVNARLVLFSTDCVFDGRRGRYVETDQPNAEELYGRTKALGEIADHPAVVTLRTSIVGRELDSAHSLVDWFLSQPGPVIKGYRRAIYSGFTTMEMARIVERILTQHRDLHGLWHVASEPINKYELLKLVGAAFGRKVQLEPYDGFVCDRSLDGSRFNVRVGYQPPSWPVMVDELAASARQAL